MPHKRLNCFPSGTSSEIEVGKTMEKFSLDRCNFRRKSKHLSLWTYQGKPQKIQTWILVVQVAPPRTGTKIQMCTLFLSDHIIITSLLSSSSSPFLVGAIVICCIVGTMTQMIELCWKLYIHGTLRPKNANSSGQTIQSLGLSCIYSVKH